MASPAITVAVSLLLVGALGYAMGFIRGKERGVAGSSEGPAPPWTAGATVDLDDTDGATADGEELPALAAAPDAEEAPFPTVASSDADEVRLRDSQLEQLRGQLGKSEAELIELRDARTQLEARLQEAEERLERTAAETDAAATMANAAETAAEIETADTQVDNDQESIDPARVAELEARLAARETRIIEMMAALERAQSEAASARLSPPAHAETAAPASGDDALRARCDAQETELEALHEELNERIEAQERLREEATDLEERYGRQIAQRDERIRELQKRRDAPTDADEEARRELEALRDERDAERERQDSTRRRGEALERQVTSLRAQLDEARREAAAMRTRAPRPAAPEPTRADPAAEALRQELAERDQQADRLRSDLQALEERTAARLSERDAEIAALRERALGAEADLERERARSAAETAARAQETGALAGVRAAAEAARSARDALEQRVAALEADLAERTTALEQARGEAGAIEARYTEQIAGRNRRVEELETRAAALTAQARDADAKAREALAQLEAARRSRQGAEGALGSAREEAAQLELQVAELRRESTRHRDQADAQLQQRAQELREREGESLDLQERLAAVSRELGEAQTRIETLDARNRDAATAAERAAREQRSELERLEGLIEARDRELQVTTATRGEVQAELQAAREELARDREQRQELERQLEARLGASQVAEANDARQATLIDALRSDLADQKERYERRLRERELETDHLGTLTQSREQELGEVVERSTRLERDLETAARRVDERDRRIEELLAEAAAVRSTRERLLRELHDREQETRQLRGLLRMEPPAEDDLTRIPGVGPTVASLLRGAGIRTIEQIAHWDDSDIEWVQEREPQLRGRLPGREIIRAARAIVDPDDSDDDDDDA